ncbi:MAG: aminotransferase class V-fold PLP-dependent enzyme [Pseudomonadota bacterium]
MDYHSEFPLDPEILYLNHAAVAPWPKRTAEAVQAFAEENIHRGAQNYPAWIKAEMALRMSLRQLLNAPSVNDIALMKNTSEALSVVAYGLEWQRGDNIVTSNEEFPSNRIVWESLAAQGVELRQADLHTAESPEDALIALIDENTRLLTISSVQYASGLRMDLERLGRYCREHGVLFCVDAIQSIGALQFDVQAIHADFVMADGHKWMLGPEGLAVFYCRAELRERLKLYQYGWHMVEDVGNYNTKQWTPAGSARRFECGSPNMLTIHALLASLSVHHELGMARIEQELLDNTAYLIELIDNESTLDVISARQPGRYAGIVTFRHKHIEPAILHQNLLRQGVICAQRGGGVRYSPHFYNSRELLERAVKLAAAG